MAGVLGQLDVSNNMIEGECMTEMAACLKKNQSLTSLSLYMNDIGDLGMEKIAEALGTNATLETLDVGGNNIRAMGMMVCAFSPESQGFGWAVAAGERGAYLGGAGSAARRLNQQARHDSLSRTFTVDGGACMNLP